MKRRWGIIFYLAKHQKTKSAAIYLRSVDLLLCFQKLIISGAPTTRRVAKRSTITMYRNSEPCSFTIILQLIPSHAALLYSLILGITVMINWQLPKQGFRWPISCDNIAGSSLELIEVIWARVKNAVRMRVFPTSGAYLPLKLYAITKQTRFRPRNSNK